MDISSAADSLGIIAFVWVAGKGTWRTGVAIFGRWSAETRGLLWLGTGAVGIAMTPFVLSSPWWILPILRHFD